MPTRSESFRLALYLFLVTGAFGFLQPFNPLMMDAAGLDKTWIGIVSGVGTGIALLVQPVLGRWSDRRDARRPFIFGCVLAAGVAFFVFPWLTSPLGFLLALAVGTNGMMYLNSAGGVLVGRMVLAHRGGAAYANLRVWGSVGFIVTVIFAGLVVGQGVSKPGLDRLYFLSTGIFLSIAALAWFLPDAKATTPDAHENPARPPLPANLSRFFLAYFLYCFALYGATSFLSLFLKGLGASGMWITAAFAGGVVCEVIVMRWSGRFSDRFGRRPALAIAFIMLPLRLMLYAPATSPAWVVAVQMLHGLNFGIVGAVAVAFVNDVAGPLNRGYAQSRLFATAGLASATSPPVLGWVAQHLGMPAMFLVAAGVAAMAAVMLLLRVEDSHPGSDSLSELAPQRLRRSLAWLDKPRTPP